MLAPPLLHTALLQAASSALASLHPLRLVASSLPPHVARLHAAPAAPAPGRLPAPADARPRLVAFASRTRRARLFARSPASPHTGLGPAPRRRAGSSTPRPPLLLASPCGRVPRAPAGFAHLHQPSRLPPIAALIAGPRAPLRLAALPSPRAPPAGSASPGRLPQCRVLPALPPHRVAASPPPAGPAGSCPCPRASRVRRPPFARYAGSATHVRVRLRPRPPAPPRVVPAPLPHLSPAGSRTSAAGSRVQRRVWLCHARPRRIPLQPPVVAGA
nr:proline-rich protein 2-like [Aegilops tauschii subsp. strangulata]